MEQKTGSLVPGVRGTGKTSAQDHPGKMEGRSTFDGLCSQRADRVLILGKTNTTNFTRNHCLSPSYPGERRGLLGSHKDAVEGGGGSCFLPLSPSSEGWRAGCDAQGKTLEVSQPWDKEEKTGPTGVGPPSQLRGAATARPGSALGEGAARAPLPPPRPPGPPARGGVLAHLGLQVGWLSPRSQPESLFSCWQNLTRKICKPAREQRAGDNKPQIQHFPRFILTRAHLDPVSCSFSTANPRQKCHSGPSCFRKQL